MLAQRHAFQVAGSGVARRVVLYKKWEMRAGVLGRKACAVMKWAACQPTLPRE